MSRHENLPPTQDTATLPAMHKDQLTGHFAGQLPVEAAHHAPVAEQGESPATHTGSGDAVQEPVDLFEQTRKRSKKLSREFITNHLNDALRIRTLDGSTGDRSYYDKIYFDQVQATPAERQFASDPEAISKVHNELADLFRDELEIYTAPNANKAHEQQVRNHLDTVKAGFLQKLEKDKDAVRTFAHTVTDPSARVRAPGSALEFRGLEIDISDGKGGAKRIDLNRTSDAGVRSNMHVQEELGQTFVHWSSPELMKARMQGTKPELTQRIYLNPRDADSVAVFREIIDEAKAQGVVMKGKVFDRASDGITNMRPALKGDDFATRADGIVLYAGEDMGRLATIVQDVYARREASFKGRGNSLVPYRIGDGFAIGDEPKGSKGDTSLTTSRLGALNLTKEAVFQELGLQNGDSIPPQLEAQAVAAYERHWNRIAQENGIDPNNLAFNLAESQEAATKSAAITQAEQAVAAATPEETTERERQFAIRQLTKGLGKNLGANPRRDERLRGFLSAAQLSEQRTLEDFSQIAGEVKWVKQQLPEGTPDSEVPKRVYEVYSNTVQAIRQKAAKENRNLNPDELRTIVRATLYADLQGMPPIYDVTDSLQNLGARRAYTARANQ